MKVEICFLYKGVSYLWGPAVSCLVLFNRYCGLKSKVATQIVCDSICSILRNRENVKNMSKGWSWNQNPATQTTWTKFVAFCPKDVG